MARSIFWLALLTLIGFPLLGIGVHLLFSDESLWIVVRSSRSLWFQIAGGVVLGTACGYGAVALISTNYMQPVRSRYAPLIAQLRLSWPMIFFVSFCAGVGEELLFRGAIQPLLGIWPTAIFFVAIHGYLNPMNKRLSVYGVFMTGIIALLGYATEWAGIWMAAIAHMMIDVVLFGYLGKSNKEEWVMEEALTPLEKIETPEDQGI